MNGEYRRAGEVGWNTYSGVNDDSRSDIMKYISKKEHIYELIPELKKAAESQKKKLGSDMDIDVHFQVPIISGDETRRFIHGWWDAVIRSAGATYCLIIIPHITTSIDRVLRTVKSYREYDSERRSAHIGIVSMDSGECKAMLKQEGIDLYVYKNR